MEARRAILHDKNGARAEICRDVSDPKRVLIRLEDGRRLFVPRSALQWSDETGYSVGFSFEGLEEAPSADGKVYVVPVSRERLVQGQPTVERKVVRLARTTEQHEEVVRDSVRISEVEIERVQVNQIIEGPMEVRYEGDTVIIPLIEEVLVVEKKLLLREELVVRRTEREEPRSQSFTLSSEHVEIEHNEGASWPPSAEELVLLRDGGVEFAETRQSHTHSLEREILDEVVIPKHGHLL